MKVTIIGGGKVGYYLVKALVEHGYEPTIIEIDKKICAYIADELDIPVFCGDGTSLSVLQEAGVKNSDAVIAVSGRDEDNLVACQLAKKIFNVKKTVVKVNNPKNASAMRSLGVDNVINSTNRIVEMLEREVDTSVIKEVVSLNHGVGSIAEINIPDNYKEDGTKIIDFKFPEGINIISIERGQNLIVPRGNTEIKSNDKLLVLSNHIPMIKLQTFLKLK